jgi:hypothetical protein
METSCLLEKDGLTSWVPLKDLKESFPVQVAEYAMVNKILEEPKSMKESSRKSSRGIGQGLTNIASYFPSQWMKPFI